MQQIPFLSSDSDATQIVFSDFSDRQIGTDVFRLELKFPLHQYLRVTAPLAKINKSFQRRSFLIGTH